MPRLRPCLGCKTLTTGSRCPDCQRPNAHQRGYDRDHQHQRAALKLTLPAPCWYGDHYHWCNTILTPDSDWVAAHLTDGDPTSPRVAACRPCNERAKRHYG